MKKQLSRTERLKLSSISFMKALKPKINKAGKAKGGEKKRSRSILFDRSNSELSRYPGTA